MDDIGRSPPSFKLTEIRRYRKKSIDTRIDAAGMGVRKKPVEARNTIIAEISPEFLKEFNALDDNDPMVIERCKEMEQKEEEAKKWKLLCSNTFTTRDGNKVCINFPAIATYADTIYFPILFKGTLYFYDQVTGVYYPEEGQIDHLLNRIVNESGYNGSIIHVMREAKAFISSQHSPVSIWPFNRSQNAIPVKNGVLAFSSDGSISFHRHSHEYMFTYVLPIEYDENADSTPIDRVLAQYVNNVEDLELLYQIAAQGLLQMMSATAYKKAYILKGNRDAGKTTFLDLLYKTFGKETIASLSLHELGVRFQKASLEGKLFNLYDELGSEIGSSISIFKAVTGGSEHQIERKGKDPYRGVITAVHVFSTNNLPRHMPIEDDAFWSRLEIVEFCNTFPRDPLFKEKIFTNANISGFFNRILEFIRRIRFENHGQLLHFSTADEVKSHWLSSSDSNISKFLSRHCIEDPEGIIPKTELQDAFESEYTGYLTSDSFFKRVKSFIPREGKHTIRLRTNREGEVIPGQSGRIPCYRGYSWREDSRFFIQYWPSIEDQQTCNEQIEPTLVSS